MKEQKDIEKIFQEAFKKFEADPGANAWSNVQSGIKANAAASGAGSSLATSSSSWVATAIVGVIITATAVGGYLFFDKKAEEQKQAIQTEKSSATPASETISSSKEVGGIETEEIPNKLNEEPKADQKETAEEKPRKESKKKKEESLHHIPSSGSSSELHNERPDSAKKVEEFASQEGGSSNEITETGPDTPVKNTTPQEQKPVAEKEDTPIVIDRSAESSRQDSNKFAPNPNTGQGGSPGDGSTPGNEDDSGIFNPMPNAFSPDQDGTNDAYRISNENIAKLRDKIDGITVYIYDGTGNIVYQWVGLYGEWNGKLRDGTLAPPGNYFYITILKAGAKEIPYKGHLSLLR